MWVAFVSLRIDARRVGVEESHTLVAVEVRVARALAPEGEAR